MYWKETIGKKGEGKKGKNHQKGTGKGKGQGEWKVTNGKERKQKGTGCFPCGSNGLWNKECPQAKAVAALTEESKDTEAGNECDDWSGGYDTNETWMGMCRMTGTMTDGALMTGPMRIGHGTNGWSGDDWSIVGNSGAIASL